MADNRRVWTEDDIAKLKSMAGRLTLKDIAAELGRSKGATAVVASKHKFRFARTPPLMHRARQPKTLLWNDKTGSELNRGFRQEQRHLSRLKKTLLGWRPWLCTWLGPSYWAVWR